MQRKSILSRRHTRPRRTLLTRRDPVAWIIRAALLSAIFAAMIVAMDDSGRGANTYAPVADTLKLLAGIPLFPGLVAYMLTGGVHASTLTDNQVLALMSVVSGAFWGTLIPGLLALPDRMRRFIEWRRAL